MFAPVPVYCFSITFIMRTEQPTNSFTASETESEVVYVKLVKTPGNLLLTVLRR